MNITSVSTLPHSTGSDNNIHPGRASASHNLNGGDTREEVTGVTLKIVRLACCVPDLCRYSYRRGEEKKWDIICC